MESELARGESKVVSNKIVDSSEKRTQTIVAEDTEEQRYSSRVENTEPLFVQNVQDISRTVNESIPFNDFLSDNAGQNTTRWREKLSRNDDDPSSGIS